VRLVEKSSARGAKVFSRASGGVSRAFSLKHGPLVARSNL
jgi:hypothetical protein